MLYIFEHDDDFDINDSYWRNPFSTSDYSSKVGGPNPRVPIDDDREIGIDMSRAYNYPNPVKDGTTSFRFYVHKSTSVKIKIYDVAGFLVKELQHTSLLPDRYNEIIWNTSGLDSALYFADITSDKGESKLIKIVIL